MKSPYSEKMLCALEACIKQSTKSPVRVLEVGSTDGEVIKNIVERMRKRVVVATTNITDEEEVPNFIKGDFLDTGTQKRILNLLGGKPDIIIGERVFDSTLPKFMQSRFDEKTIEAIQWCENRSERIDTLFEIPTPPEFIGLDTKIVEAAYKFLTDDGILVFRNDQAFRNPSNVRVLFPQIEQILIRGYRDNYVYIAKKTTQEQATTTKP